MSNIIFIAVGCVLALSAFGCPPHGKLCAPHRRTVPAWVEPKVPVRSYACPTCAWPLTPFTKPGW